MFLIEIVLDFCGWLWYWFVLQGGSADAAQQKSTIKTTEEKTAGAALVWGVSGPKPRFRIKGVRGWIFWTRCGMGL